MFKGSAAMQQVNAERSVPFGEFLEQNHCTKILVTRFRHWRGVCLPPYFCDAIMLVQGKPVLSEVCEALQASMFLVLWSPAFVCVIH
jgi:hypothetical protein